jgi:hypothetical protein
LKNRVYLVLVVFLIAALGWAGWQAVRPRPSEPVYHGKPLNYWLSVEPVPEFVRFQLVPDSNAVPFLNAALKRDGWAGAAFYRKWLWPKLYPRIPTSAQRYLPMPRPAIEITRLNAAALLGGMGPIAHRSIPVLIKAMEDDESNSVRMSAAWALGRVGTGDKRATAALAQASVNDANARIRVIALAALGRLGQADQAAVSRIFESLSPSAKLELLRRDWALAQTPLLLAPLMKVLNNPLNSSGQGLVLRDWALVRACDLDPRTMRPLLLAEVREPHIPVGYVSQIIEALVAMPDETLPEIDEAFAGQLSRDAGFDGLDLSLRLISRYATKAIEPQVKAFFEPSAGRWACPLQASMLAYFLRVDDAYGTEAFARCLASRETGCRQMLFTDVGRQVWMPALEKLALEALGNQDAAVREDATNALMKFGPESAAKARQSGS